MDTNNELASLLEALAGLIERILEVARIIVALVGASHA